MQFQQLRLPFEEKSLSRKELFYASSYLVLEKELLRKLNSAKKQNISNKIIVVVPSGACAMYFKRKIDAGGIRFLNFRDFALETARNIIIEKNLNEISPVEGEALAQKAIEETLKEGEFLYSFIESPGFSQVFLSLLKDFRQGGFDNIPEPQTILRKMEINSKGLLNYDRLKSIFNLFNNYRKKFQTGLIDVEDAMSIALQNAADFKNIFSAGHLFIYGFSQLDPAQRELVSKISNYADTIAFLPFLNENEISEDMLDYFRKSGFESFKLQDQSEQNNINIQKIKNDLFNVKHNKEKAGADGSVSIISCQTPQEEIKEIARLILKTAEEGASFDKSAIVLKESDEYKFLIREIFSSLGIPCYFQDGLPLESLSAGKTLKLFLALAGSGFKRFEVTEFIKEGSLDFKNIIADQNYHVTPSIWDHITKETGIRKGYGDWVKRLKRSLEKTRKSEFDEAKEPNNSEKHEISAKIKDIETLLIFIKNLKDDLDSFTKLNSWKNFIINIEKIIEKYFQKTEETRTLLFSIKKLSKLDKIYSPVSFDTFRTTLSNYLSSDILCEGEFNAGYVNVLSLRGAGGLTFDNVFIPGMIFGSYPDKRNENPLMTDEEKRIFNENFTWKGRLMERKEVQEMNPLLFSSVVRACKNNLTLTFPRFNFDSGQASVISPYILDVGNILSEKEILYKNIGEIPCFTRLSPEFYRKDPQMDALDPAEFRKRALREEDRKKHENAILFTASQNKILENSINLMASRNRRDYFTKFEGKISDGDLLSRLCEKITKEYRVTSPSRLEEYYRCPYSFFLKNILGVRPLTSPDDQDDLEPKDRGSIYHRFFYKFFKKMKEENKIPINPDLLRDYLLETESLADEIIKDWEETGNTGLETFWFQNVAQINRNFKEFVERESKESASSDFSPALFESPFGESEPGVNNADSGVYIDAGDGKRYYFRGRIDRIDTSADGKTCVVIDYKTGKSDGYKPKELKGGSHLQLPVYLYAAKTLLKQTNMDIEIENSSAQYYFATSKGNFKKVEFNGGHLKDREEDIKKLVSGVAGNAQKGLFIPYPGGKSKIDNGENCRICDFASVCPKDVVELYQKKSLDPFITEFLTLKEIE